MTIKVVQTIPTIPNSQNRLTEF